LRLWGTAAAGLALDLWSKHWAFHSLRQSSPPRVVIPHVLEFQTMLNDGALFGIGSGQTVLFVAASVLALVLVIWMFVQSSPKRWTLQIALGAILAGALGNMYDRIFVKLIPLGSGRPMYFVRSETERGLDLLEYPPDLPGVRQTVRGVPPGSFPNEVGYVRDFIKLPIKFPTPSGWRELWPWVFNVADSLLVVGVSILAVHLWRDRAKQPAT
jgi:lipoprotein signal peptidase